MNDLEFLRECFKDSRLHIGVGPITQIGLSEDSNTLRAMVRLLPEEREVVTTVTWEGVNRASFPQVNDLVLVAFVDGHPDEAFVLRYLSTGDDPIPTFAQAGHLCDYAREGKKAYYGSDTKISLARPGKEPSQPMVLGTVMIAALNALVNAFLNAAQVGQCAVGPTFLDPTVRTALLLFQSTYLVVSNTNIVSQIAFVERGTE